MVAGIQGPVILAQAGDRVVVHFKNLASQPYSISPVGITYWKQSEGTKLRGRNCCHPLNMNVFTLSPALHHKLSISQQHSVLPDQVVSQSLIRLF